MKRRVTIARLLPRSDFIVSIIILLSRWQTAINLLVTAVLKTGRVKLWRLCQEPLWMPTTWKSVYIFVAWCPAKNSQSRLANGIFWKVGIYLKKSSDLLNKKLKVVIQSSDSDDHSRYEANENQKVWQRLKAKFCYWMQNSSRVKR